MVMKTSKLTLPALKAHNSRHILAHPERKDLALRLFSIYQGLPIRGPSALEAGCSQEEGPKKGFVMGSRTRGVQEILEKCM